MVVEINPKLIGAAMPDRREHSPQQRLLRRVVPRQVADSGDAAHNSSDFRIFPEGVLGRAEQNSMYFGTMNSSRCRRQCVTTCAVGIARPSVGMTPLIASPRSASGTPNTAASATPGSA